MRKFIITLNLWLLGCISMLAQQPAWVTSHPTDDNSYIGIGFAPLKDPYYIKKATQNALNDIALQIATRIESNSFMHTVDIDGKSRELFEDKIKSSVVSYLEGQTKQPMKVRSKSINVMLSAPVWITTTKPCKRWMPTAWLMLSNCLEKDWRLLHHGCSWT